MPLEPEDRKRAKSKKSPVVQSIVRRLKKKKKKHHFPISTQKKDPQDTLTSPIKDNRQTVSLAAT